MNTQAVADRLLVLVNEGKNTQAEKELYAEDVVSREQDGTSAAGLENIIKKTEGAMAGIEEFYGSKNTLLAVNQDSFLMHFEMDMKPKGGERLKAQEYGWYKVKNGKVVEEYFYFV